jgi:hypothetical protein
MKDVAKKLQEHAAQPASKAHKGLRKGGKTNLDMKKYGRGMAKVMNPAFSRKGSIMAKYSMKVKGKEIGPAELYAPPHTMDGKPTNVTTYTKTETGPEEINKVNMGVGFYSKGNYPPVNPYGVGEMRGYGAAIKGRKISGKMG